MRIEIPSKPFKHINTYNIIVYVLENCFLFVGLRYRFSIIIMESEYKEFIVLVESD